MSVLLDVEEIIKVAGFYDKTRLHLIGGEVMDPDNDPHFVMPEDSPAHDFFTWADEIYWNEYNGESTAKEISDEVIISIRRTIKAFATIASTSKYVDDIVDAGESIYSLGKILELVEEEAQDVEDRKFII